MNDCWYLMNIKLLFAFFFGNNFVVRLAFIATLIPIHCICRAARRGRGYHEALQSYSIVVLATVCAAFSLLALVATLTCVHNVASLAASQQLYDICPLEVKRQIWLADGDVFRKEVFPILTELIAETNARDPLYELLPDDDTPPPALRRQQVLRASYTQRERDIDDNDDNEKT